jgi:hypothetical protein
MLNMLAMFQEVAAAAGVTGLLGAGLAFGLIIGAGSLGPDRRAGGRGDRPQPGRAAIRGAALLIAVLLEGATIIALVFAVVKLL